MRTVWVVVIGALVVGTMGVPALPAQEVIPAIERVSVSSGGGQADSGSLFYASASADGRYVAFWSYAANLVPGDTNGFPDVFVRDRLAGTTVLASPGLDGVGGNSETYPHPVISDDGRYVALRSRASNLVAGDVNGVRDIFVYDLLTRSTEMVSVGTGGESSDAESAFFDMSSDGRFVVFSSSAVTIGGNPTNGKANLFVRDRQLGTTEILPLNLVGGISLPIISDDGRFVSFQLGYGNGDDQIYRYDRGADVVEPVSIFVATGAVGPGYAPSMSSDGRYITFVSNTPLLESDTNIFLDLYLRDMESGVLEVVSVTNDGLPGNQSVAYPTGIPSGSKHQISDDGQKVTFVSKAKNLTDDPTIGGGLYVRDRAASTTTFLALGQYGSISGDGQVVVFASEDSTLVDGDTNGFSDIFAVGTMFSGPPPPPPECAFGDVAVIAARGSGEDNDRVGSPGDYGRVFKAELEKRLGDTVTVTLSGVNYPAVAVDSNTLASYGSSVNDGVETLKVGLREITETCPANLPRIVLIGYSQGANVIQGALEEIADDPLLGPLPTSVGLFANPMFTYTDPSARGTFAHSATGVAGLPFFVPDASVHTAAVPEVYSDITRTWCIADDPVCDLSAQTGRKEVFEDSTHTGSGYGVYRDFNSDGVLTGEHAMADVLATAVWALGRSGLTIPEPPAPGLLGSVGGQSLIKWVERSRTGVTYSATVFWSAADVVNTAGPVQLYLWDLDGDGVYDQSGPSPIGVADYTLFVPKGTKGTSIGGSVKVVGATGAIATYQLCFDLKRQKTCGTRGG